MAHGMRSQRANTMTPFFTRARNRTQYGLAGLALLAYLMDPEDESFGHTELLSCPAWTQ